MKKAFVSCGIPLESVYCTGQDVDHAECQKGLNAKSASKLSIELKDDITQKSINNPQMQCSSKRTEC